MYIGKCVCVEVSVCVWREYVHVYSLVAWTDKVLALR